MKLLLTAVRAPRPGLQGGAQHPSCDQNPGQRHLQRRHSVKLNSSLHICQWPGPKRSLTLTPNQNTYVCSSIVSSPVRSHLSTVLRGYGAQLCHRLPAFDTLACWRRQHRLLGCTLEWTCSWKPGLSSFLYTPDVIKGRLKDSKVSSWAHQIRCKIALLDSKEEANTCRAALVLLECARSAKRTV